MARLDSAWAVITLRWTLCTKYSTTLTMWLTVAVTIMTTSLPIQGWQSPELFCWAVSHRTHLALALPLGPVFETKATTSKSGNGGRPSLVWCVPCKRRCVLRFTKFKQRHRHRNDRCCETHSVESGLSQSPAGEAHGNSKRSTLFSLSQTNYDSNHR